MNNNTSPLDHGIGAEPTTTGFDTEVMNPDSGNEHAELERPSLRDRGFHTAEGLAAAAVFIAVLVAFRDGLDTVATAITTKLTDLVG